MSVSDPLLKKLKVHVYELRTDPKPIEDHHRALIPLCEVLEVIFRKGLKQSNSLFGMARRDYWHCMEAVAAHRHYNSGGHPFFCMSVDMVKKCDCLFSSQGRGRLFMRAALQKKALVHAVEQLVTWSDKGVYFWYDADHSILGNEILREIFKSLLYQVNEIDFQLCLKNRSFLDQTWQLPIYQEHEFVPTKDLGIEIQHCDSRIIVCGLDPKGVACDVGKIEVGDVIDNVMGETMRYIPRGKIQTLLRHSHGHPVHVGFSKCKLADGSIYQPIGELLQGAGKDISSLQNVLEQDGRDKRRSDDRKPPHALLPDEEWDEIPVHNAEDKAEYRLQFVGDVHVGSNGGMDQIEKVIGQILAEKNPDKHPEFMKDVVFELGETDVIVTDPHTKELIYKHSYTEISSCGRRVDCLKYFAYIAGETTCTISKQFIAYIFKTDDDTEGKIILCSIAQGFSRTHWFV